MVMSLQVNALGVSEDTGSQMTVACYVVCTPKMSPSQSTSTRHVLFGSPANRHRHSWLMEVWNITLTVDMLYMHIKGLKSKPPSSRLGTPYCMTSSLTPFRRHKHTSVMIPLIGALAH